MTAEQPRPGARDLLVEVQAISVNPVDAKIRSGGGPGRPDGQRQILTPDMDEQGRLLNEVAALVEAGRIQTTMQVNLGAINAANMKKAHLLIESGKTIGKIVLAGF